MYYGWSPNLPDEGDSHLIELALAGGAQATREAYSDLSPDLPGSFTPT